MSSVPPVPVLPPQLRVQHNQESYHPSPPHLEEPLLAPRPHKLTPDLPAEVGSTTSHYRSIYLKKHRWRAPSTVKFPVPRFIPLQLITIMTEPQLFPLTHPIPPLAFFSPVCPRRLLRQGHRGMFPSRVRHP